MPVLRALRTEPLLIDKIKAVHVEINQFIAAKVAALKLECPGIPDAALDREITRGDNCVCRVYAILNKDKD
jgi:hypothetical protein